MPRPSKKPPQTPGERLFAAVTEAYALDEHELVLLHEAGRTADLCADLQAVLDEADGPLMSTRAGVRAHPAAVELRQQRVTLARLLVARRVPAGEEEASGPSRLPVRGPRGFYGKAS